MEATVGTVQDDVLKADGQGGNVLIGRAGNDTLHSSDMGDVLIGDGSKGVAKPKPVDASNIKIAQDVVAHVSFDGSTAGFHNAVGIYVYDKAGLVTDVRFLYNDVSWQGAMGGPGGLDVPLKAGQQIGFFVAPNAFAYSADVLARTDGKFIMFDATNGAPANVNAGHEMQIAFHANDDSWAMVNTHYGASIFTTHANDNIDGFQHAVTTVDKSTGTLSVALEDLWAGGDQNFQDAKFSLTIGKANVAALGGGHNEEHKDHNDTLVGGTGNDKLMGMRGDDMLFGGLGDNHVNGGSGNDLIVAGGGNDDIVGGKGFDTLDFGKATGGVKVDLEAHTADGFGSSRVSGVEALVGSKFDDVLVGDKVDNALFGGAGHDVLRGGRGSDTLTGGDGQDTFLFLKKDVVDKNGKLQGVDHITDFAQGDTLDLRDLFKGMKGAHEVVVKDGADGTHVYAQLGKQMVEVAVLDGVHNTSAAELVKAGALLV